MRIPTTPSGSAPHKRVSARARAALFGLFLALALALFFLGPTNAFGPNVPTVRPAPPVHLAQLDSWLAAQEAVHADIRPGLAKGVVWHGAPGQRTPWAVVYLHGFTASRLETAPLAEQVAARLGANLFHTRLSGHGRSASAMGEATVQDWLADGQEALRIGRLLGEQVLVVGVSTGATLATWLAQQPEGRQGVTYAFISPNYGPRNKTSEWINLPWGRELALAMEGDMRGQPSEDARENHAWTRQYPTRALFPMMALVKQVRESDLSGVTAPVLVLYAEADETVDPAETKALFPRLGSTRKALEVVDYSEAKGQHVLAGDIRAPAATDRMAQRLADWALGR